MQIPMLFDIREQAEKEEYKFEREGAHQIGKNGCHAVCTNKTTKIRFLFLSNSQ